MKYLLTSEQKQCPQGSVTGASNHSEQMLHLVEESSFRSPGASLLSGKSVGSEMSDSRRADSAFSWTMSWALYQGDADIDASIKRVL